MSRALTREEVAAMWLFGVGYSRQTGGAIDFWKGLLEPDKQNVREFLAELDRAEVKT